MNMERLLQSVKDHEGYRNKVYLDTLNKRTIGVGHLCVEDFWEDDKEYEEKFLMTILEHDLQTAVKGSKELMEEHGCSDIDDLAKEITVKVLDIKQGRTKFDIKAFEEAKKNFSINKMVGTKWVINATLSDAFNTRRMGTNFQTPYYIQELSRRRESRYVRLTLTYIFGKMDASIFKRAKQMKGSDSQQGSQDGLDFGK